MILNKVHFYTGQIIDNYIYASQSFYNGLIRIDLKTNQAKYISCFPGEKAVTSVLHRYSLLYGEKIFFIPCFANNVSVFDAKDESIKSIPISIYNKGSDNKKCYYVNGNKLIVVPVSGRGKIISINMDDHSVEILDDKKELLRGTAIIDICKEGNFIFYAKCGSNRLVKYDLEKDKVSEIDTSVTDIQSVSKGREGLWLIRNTNESLCCIKDEKEIIYNLNGKPHGLLVKTFDFDGGVYAIPYRFDTFLKKENGKNDFEEVDISNLGIKKYYGYPGAFSYDIIEANDNIYIPPYNVNKMLVINKMTGQISARDLLWEEPVDIPNIEIRKTISEELCNEGLPIDLKTFIEII